MDTFIMEYYSVAKNDAIMKLTALGMLLEELPCWAKLVKEKGNKTHIICLVYKEA